MPHHVCKLHRDEIFPVLAERHSSPHFGRRDVIPGRIHREPNDPGAVMPCRFVIALARRDEQPIFPQHFLEDAGPPVIPCSDAFGRITTADQADFRGRAEEQARLIRDFGVKAAFGDCCRKATIAGGFDQFFQHPAAVFEAGALEAFVGEGAGQYPDQFVRQGARGAGDFQMGDRGRVPRAGEDRDTAGRGDGTMEKFQGQ